jgi:hypothetical protein
LGSKMVVIFRFRIIAREVGLVGMGSPPYPPSIKAGVQTNRCYRVYSPILRPSTNLRRVFHCQHSRDKRLPSKFGSRLFATRFFSHRYRMDLGSPRWKRAYKTKPAWMFAGHVLT